MQRKMHKIALARTWKFWMTQRHWILFLTLIIEEVSQYIYFWLYFMQLYACMQLISRVYELRNFLVMFHDLRLYTSFEFHSDLTIVFRSFDYLRPASFTVFHKRITYLIYFSLWKNENDLQFSINLRLITFDKHQMIIIIRKLIKFCILHNRFFSIWVW